MADSVSGTDVGQENEVTDIRRQANDGRQRETGTCKMKHRVNYGIIG